MTLLSRFLRKTTHLFFTLKLLQSEDRPYPPQGFCSAQTQERLFFSTLCRRHVVKGFGSDCLTAVGGFLCVRASFMAVEIWCGEQMHMELYISPCFCLKCIQTTSSYWELHYTAQGNTSSLWLHHGSLSGLCLTGFFLSITQQSERMGSYLLYP